MSNNHPSEKFHYGQIWKLAAPFSASPSFAIPLVRFNDFSNALYVQRVDEAGVVIDFDLFVDLCQTIDLKQPVDVEIGGKEILACVDPLGTPVAGNRKKIALEIKKWIADVTSPLQRLSFAIACQSPKLLEGAARAALDKKVIEFKDRNYAILWFVRNVALLQLIRPLHRHAPSNNPVNFFSTLTADVSIEDARLVIRLPAALLEKQSKNLYRRDLAAVLGMIERITHLNIDLKEQHSAPQKIRENVNVEDSYQDLMTRISKHARQEQRLSVLIKAIIEEPEVGKAALSNYSDKAAFAQRVLLVLREFLNSNDNAQITQFRIAQALQRALAEAYPRQRQRLLMDLREILGAENKVLRLMRKTR